MAIGDKIGVGAADKIHATVDDIQADLTQRWGTLLAFLEGKRLVSTTTIELVDKEPVVRVEDLK